MTWLHTKFPRMVASKRREMASDDKTTIVYNESITLGGIPLEAYEYIVNGKSAIEWVRTLQKVSRDRKKRHYQ